VEKLMLSAGLLFTPLRQDVAPGQNSVSPWRRE